AGQKPRADRDDDEHRPDQRRRRGAEDHEIVVPLRELWGRRLGSPATTECARPDLEWADRPVPAPHPNPLPAGGEREGPAAKPWEGKGRARCEPTYHSTDQAWDQL